MISLSFMLNAYYYECVMKTYLLRSCIYCGSSEYPTSGGGGVVDEVPILVRFMSHLCVYILAS